MKGHQKSAMAFQGSHLLDFLVRLSIATTIAVSSVAVAPGPDTALFNRSKFPAGFIFGAASSSYQYEGAAFESGRGPSTWDNFTHKYPEKITDHSTGDVAVDSYHRYKEDIRILKDMNMDAYRFSISWTRVLPNGKLSGGVNKKGVAYYNNLINGLLANGLRPYVTIFHWDFPQALEEEYGGFLSPKSVDHFRDYSELCFKRFGDRVKHWITLNEPWSYSRNGYATGSMAPGRCSAWQQRNCTGGNSGTEPYLATHYQILAHGAAVRLYKEKYQASQKGIIGITLNTYWYIPMFETKDDHDAAQRAVDFMFGWYMDPLASGDYPPSMRSLVGDRLPHFTKEESAMLKGSFDFLGLNYYSTYYAANLPVSNNTNPSYLTDYHANLTAERNGIPIGPRGASKWLYVYPKGIKDLLLYIKTTYNNPLIYITENGINEENDPKLPLGKALVDNKRIEYHARHLAYLLKAIKHGVKVNGYFAWSLLDNFEWYSGYSVRFGFYYIDYSDGLKRHPKLSALWFRNFLKGTR